MRRVRPRYRQECTSKPDEIVAAIGKLLKTPGCPVSGLACPGRIELHVHGEQQRLWSPQLIVDLEESESGTVLRGRFGPHPSVWTMYVAGYAASVFGILVGSSFAYAQWVMNEKPWALLSLPVCALLSLALYGLAFWGQHESAEQMKQLRRFLRGALRDMSPLESKSSTE